MTRSSNGIIAGVCAGLAEHLGVNRVVVRAVMAALTLAGGAGLLLYAWLWVMVPIDEGAAATIEDRAGERPGPGRTARHGPAAFMKSLRSGAQRDVMSLGGREVVIGLALLFAAAVLVAEQIGANIRWESMLPVVVVLLGAVLVWMQLDRTRRAGLVNRAGANQAGGIVRIGAGLVLVIVGVLVMVSGAGRWEVMWSSVLASLAVLAGVALVLAPWGLKFWRDLEAERSGRIRESERAEIAAHLHDSVLQTLALIQNRAGHEQDVTRLARAQERELRQWLYQDAGRDPGNVVARIKAVAAEVEDDYGSAVDVVAVGDAPMSTRQDALVQAAREAIVNAARHAGPVSVYVEAGADKVEVFVRDRGDGFVVDDIPADRLGVRESIVGRMQRNGGSATINSTADGTEVCLSLQTEPEERQ
ncbi:ATP-binding protein [Arthrobacter castelli]|uniref:ATP-binding protein n=1 Tax=Arthrobacter castelli TaxID=271431 RepID=UPI000559F5C6|nr:ATP-binding protein [Arthrobacter castelli]